MEFRKLKDDEYKKALDFLEKCEENPNLKKDKILYNNYRLVDHIIDLHDRGEFPYSTSISFEMMQVKMGLIFIKDL